MALPARPTALVGRVTELASARNRLARSDVRLLTLIGPGGSGKTRLAVELAAAVRDAGTADPIADEVAFVDLTPIGDPSLVAAAVAERLGIGEERGQPVAAALLRLLCTGRRLVVLDNFEHVLDAAPLINDLLTACDGLKVLATSREPLRLRWEHLLPVPPLPVPDPAQLHTPEALADSPAVALFVQRAQAVRPDFRLTHANAPAVATLCGRLDGLPLALELAAARMRVFPPEAILARLDQRRGRLELLRAREQDRHPRHQGLHETIGWSYGLLDPAEQLLFRQLSVFTGSWATDGAEALVGHSVLDELASLVDKSLLVVQDSPAPDGELPRFEMLETIREYAFERLDEAGEAPRTRDRHVVYYLALAERVDAALRGPHLREGLARLAAEQGNLRAALVWCLDSGDGAGNEHGLRLAVALSWAWYVRGDFTEGRLWLGRALAPGQTPASTETPESRALRALGLARAGAFAYFQGDIRSAGDLLDRSLATAQSLGDVHTAAEALHWKMLVLEAAEGLGSGVALLEQSLHLYRGLDDAWSTSWSLGNLARVTVEQGDHARAARLASEALALAETAGDPWMVGMWLHLHWVLARTGLQRDPTRAAEALETRLPESDLFADSDRQGSVRVKVRQASLLASMAESLILRRDLGNRSGVIQSLEDFAWVACVRDHARLAARLVGAADYLRRAVGLTVDALSMRDREALVASLRVRLGDAYEAEYAVGAALSADQAIGEALELAAPGALETGQPTSGRTRQEKSSPLSPREREVAALAAHGLMNRQIAERLVISERTVEAHIAHILTKLGLASRVQLAAWVVANERQPGGS